MTTPFRENVYALVKQIPCGKVTTYGAISKALTGNTKASRAVGSAMRNTPYPYPSDRDMQIEAKHIP